MTLQKFQWQKSPERYFQPYLHLGSYTEVSHFNRMDHIFSFNTFLILIPFVYVWEQLHKDSSKQNTTVWQVWERLTWRGIKIATFIMLLFLFDKELTT